MIRGILLVAVLTSCGRIGYDPSARLEDAALVDAEVLGTFGMASMVSELADPGGTGDDPTLTGDRLELYLNSSRPGGVGMGDIWMSTRATTSDTWSTPIVVAELSSPGTETSPEVSADGLAIWFASNRAGGQGGTDIWVSTRANRQLPWSAPTIVSELSSPSSDTASAPGWSQLVMILESTRAGGSGEADLYMATRPTTTSTWSTPMPLTEINTPDHEGSPHLGPQNLTLVFNTNRGGNPDLYIATRASVDEPFGTAVPLTEINSPQNEQDPWISADLRGLVFVSARSGSLEIYEASR